MTTYVIYTFFNAEQMRKTEHENDSNEKDKKVVAQNTLKTQSQIIQFIQYTIWNTAYDHKDTEG